MFKGNLLHGVIPGIGLPVDSSEKRISLMIAFWKDITVRPFNESKPCAAQAFPLTTLHQSDVRDKNDDDGRDDKSTNKTNKTKKMKNNSTTRSGVGSVDDSSIKVISRYTWLQEIKLEGDRSSEISDEDLTKPSLTTSDPSPTFVRRVWEPINKEKSSMSFSDGASSHPPSYSECFQGF
jgi:hypothetical protein